MFQQCLRPINDTMSCTEYRASSRTAINKLYYTTTIPSLIYSSYIYAPQPEVPLSHVTPIDTTAPLSSLDWITQLVWFDGEGSEHLDGQCVSGWEESRLQTAVSSTYYVLYWFLACVEAYKRWWSLTDCCLSRWICWVFKRILLIRTNY
jgi:hypothetical protein